MVEEGEGLELEILVGAGVPADLDGILDLVEGGQLVISQQMSGYGVVVLLMQPPTINQSAGMKTALPLAP